MRPTPSLNAERRSRNLLETPQVFRRTFECGHPDEFIETRLADDGEKLHILISLENFQERTQTETRLTYTEGRCLTCAKQVKSEDDKDQSVRPKRSLSAYQSGTSSTHQRGLIDLPRDAFERTLERHKLASGQTNIRKLHPRVSEQEHRAHRLGVLKEAVRCPGKWLALPPKRITNVPIRRANEVDMLAWQEDKSRSLGHDYNSIQRAKEQIMERRPSKEEPVYRETDCTPLGPSHRLKSYRSSFAAVEAAGCTETYLVEEPGAFSVESGWNVAEESYRDAQNESSLSGSRLKRQQRLSESIESTVSIDYTLNLENAKKKSESKGRATCVGTESALTEHLIGQPFDRVSFERGSYESPRLAPAAPTRGPFSFRRRQSSTTTGVSIQSEPGSRNVRKLSIDMLQSAKSLRGRESVDGSPDWACQTSLAIEAGRLSMDDVGIQSRNSTSSKYGAEAIPHSIELVPSKSRRQQEVASGLEYKFPTLPSVGYGPLLDTPSRHSKGALQAVRKAEEAHQIENFSGMEINRNREWSKHHQAKVVPSVNLNKRLPALPPPGSWTGGDV